MPSATGSAPAIRLLLIESDSPARRTMARDLGALSGSPGAVTAVESGREATELLRTEAFELVLADVDSLTDLGCAAEEAIGRIARLADGALIVALAKGGSVSAAVAAMRAGAHDFIAKPVAATALAARIEELAQRHGKARALAPDVRKAATDTDFEGFVGVSSQMTYVYEQIERLAQSSAPVFITGESGTGKEVCAEALHRRGARAGRPFVAINCSAIPRDLMESELFGAARGAYTGAVAERMGAAEMAAGGTLFLDEIGEMDLSLQAKLLRFLQTGVITRIGEAVNRPVDVRVVCATNRNPMQLISERKFREDLFYRLHVLPIHLPPLRQRPADILPLARHFLAQFAAEEGKGFAGLGPETANMLIARDWPGNVRQLQNLIRRIVVMFDGEVVEAAMVQAADIESRNEPAASPAPAAALPVIAPMWRQEQRIIEEAIVACGGNIARAAAALEISPSTIYRKRQFWDQMDGEAQGAA